MFVFMEVVCVTFHSTLTSIPLGTLRYAEGSKKWRLFRLSGTDAIAFTSEIKGKYIKGCLVHLDEMQVAGTDKQGMSLGWPDMQQIKH